MTTAVRVELGKIENIKSKLNKTEKDIKNLSEDIFKPLSQAITDVEKEIALTKNEFRIIKETTRNFEIYIPKIIMPFGQAIEHFGTVIRDFLDVKQANQKTYSELVEWTTEMTEEIKHLKKTLENQDEKINNARKLLRREIKFNANDIKEFNEIKDFTDKIIQDLTDSRRDIIRLYEEISKKIPEKMREDARKEAVKFGKEKGKPIYSEAKMPKLKT
jgi:DNA repair exonuclease SbcCD ATPase subunit